MKAVIWTRYGPPDVLKLQEVPKPTPKDNEVLIKVHAATVTAGDTELRELRLPIEYRIMLRFVIGLTRPKRATITGMEVAGKIEAVGKDVRRLKEGDEVFGITGFSFGAHAQYVCLPEKLALAIKPSNMSYEEAACIVIGGIESLHFLRAANIQKGQKVMIYGASGSIGTAGVQVAKFFGAEVTGVCSTNKMEMVRSIGADKLIDYTKEDYSKRSERYDLILDAVPQQVADRKKLKSRAQNLLTPDGKYISIDDGIAKTSKEDLVMIMDLAKSGKFKPVIDRSYPLEKMVEAHKYVEKGHKKGNVVITVDQKRG